MPADSNYPDPRPGTDPGGDVVGLRMTMLLRTHAAWEE
jgi:hypothetical protein